MKIRISSTFECTKNIISSSVAICVAIFGVFYFPRFFSGIDTSEGDAFTPFVMKALTLFMAVLAVAMIQMLAKNIFMLHAIKTGQENHLKGLLAFDIIGDILLVVLGAVFLSIFFKIGIMTYSDAAEATEGEYASSKYIALTFCVVSVVAMIGIIVKSVKSAVKEVKLYSPQNFMTITEYEDYTFADVIKGRVSEANAAYSEAMNKRNNMNNDDNNGNNTPFQ